MNIKTLVLLIFLPLFVTSISGCNKQVGVGSSTPTCNEQVALNVGELNSIIYRINHPDIFYSSLDELDTDIESLEALWEETEELSSICNKKVLNELFDSKIMVENVKSDPLRLVTPNTKRLIEISYKE